MRTTSHTKVAAMLACLLVVLSAGAYGPLQNYIQTVKQRISSTEVFASANSEDPLMNWIKTEAEKQNIPAVDAVIDRIWKAIPGYDGREVDIQATYNKAKIIGSVPGRANDFPWVYRDVKPNVGLEDLPLQPIYRGNPSKPMVALMINVAWGDEYLTPMLDILQEEKVKATFFFDGSWLAKNTDMAKLIISRGHEVSNHAYSHPNMSQLSIEQQRSQIGRTEALLKKLGASNVWFAPPSGDYDMRTVRTAAEFGLRTVLWTLDTLDWRKPPSGSVVAKVSAKVGPGTLILMHPTSTSQGALRGMIKAIRAKGYSLGTVSDTLSTDRV